MRDPPRELHFASKSLIHALIGGNLGPDGFERDALAKRKVLSFVQLPHATARDEPDNAETLAEQVPFPERREARELGGTRVIDVRRRLRGIVVRGLHLYMDRDQSVCPIS
jgi:hypothetical protein